MKKTGTKKLKNAMFTVLTVIFTAAITASFVTGIYIRIELARENDTIIELNREISDITERNRRLRIEYESGISLSELEAFAKDTLGMKAPDREQIRMLDVKGQIEQDRD